MKKKLFVLSIVTLLVSGISFGQAKDTVVNKDSAVYVSQLIEDIKTVQKYIYGKVSSEDYDKAREFFNILLNYGAEKRRKAKKQ